MPVHELIRAIERCSMNGLPALKTLDLDGWILRFSDGHTNRANTVNPLEIGGSGKNGGPGESGDPGIARRITRCEELYTEASQPTIFKMTDAVQPKDLERILRGIGYRDHGSVVNVQTCDLGQDAGPGKGMKEMWGADEEFRIVREPQVSFRWFTALARMNSLSHRSMNILSRMLRRIEQPSMFVRIELFGRSVGCGYGVVEDGFLGLFDILVDEGMRRQGIGGIVMDELMEWGRGQGTGMAYLQVVDDNWPALELYRKLGFGTAYQYWYLKNGEGLE